MTDEPVSYCEMMAKLAMAKSVGRPVDERIHLLGLAAIFREMDDTKKKETND